MAAEILAENRIKRLFHSLNIRLEDHSQSGPLAECASRRGSTGGHQEISPVDHPVYWLYHLNVNTILVVMYERIMS